MDIIITLAIVGIVAAIARHHGYIEFRTDREQAEQIEVRPLRLYQSPGEAQP